MQSLQPKAASFINLGSEIFLLQTAVLIFSGSGGIDLEIHIEYSL